MMNPVSALRTRLAHGVNQHIYYGWVMLAVSFIGMFATGPAQSFNVSIFVNPLIEELGASRTGISGAYAIGTLTAALGFSFVGRMIDRHGPRVAILTFVVAQGVVALIFPFATHIAALYVLFTALRFFGQGSLTLGVTNLASQWFSRRRGFALSITTLGFGLASAIYPPVVHWLISEFGWRTGWVVLGVFTMVLMVPPVLLLVVNRPEDMGMAPDGGAMQGNREAAHDTEGGLKQSTEGGSKNSTEDSTGKGTGKVSEKGADRAMASNSAPQQDPSPPHDDGSYTLREAMHTAAFWIMAIAMAIPSLIITGVIFHQISYFQQQGMDAQSAANIFTVTAMSMVVFTLVFGQLLDRFETRYVVGGGLMLLTLAMWVMLWADTPLLAALYGVVLGAASGSMMTNATYVWPRYFGRLHLGGIQGAGFTVGVIGASIGPMPFGMAYDLLGGYHEVVLGLSFLPTVFGFVVFFTPPPIRKRFA